MGKKKSKSAGAGGRRPRRQRTQVQHYTDDIPGTFTRKKRRRRSEGSESSDSDSDSDEAHHPKVNDDRRIIRFDEFESLEEAATAEKNKKKRKRPAKAASECSSTVSTSSSKSPHHRKQPKPHIKPTLQEMPAPSPPKTTMLSHTASVAPILPLATTCPLARESLAQQYPVVFGRGLDIPQPPSTPDWKLLPPKDFYFPEDYLEVSVACQPASEQDEPRTAVAPVLQSGPWPVCRVVTSVCSYQNWMAVGDSAGFVLIFGTGPSAIKLLTRLDTSASKREHARQRQIQTEVELRCRHKPELLEKRSAFWAMAKTPNAIQCMTWTQKLILVLTSQEIEAIQLTSANTNFEASQTRPSTCKGGSRHCKVVWTVPVATVGGPRKYGSNSLLTGGELVGSYLELHKKGTMAVWNTWGVAVAKKNANDDGGSSSDEDSSTPTEDDWPLLLLRDPTNAAEAPTFIQIIPFQRQEEEEKPPPVPIKRSPGRPPKKKPKPKIPVAKSELVWTEDSKCHAVMWDNHAHKGDRLIIAYSATSTISASDAQVQLALLKLTDDSSVEEASSESTTLTTSSKPQFAKLLKQSAVPLVGSVRNVANVPEVTLQQSPKGTYTLVAGSRGVRMYQTDDMTLLRVYGENVSLHGKTMVWKSCFVLDNRLQQQLYKQQAQQMEPLGSGNDGDEEDQSKSETILRQNRQGFVWIEQENPLAALLDNKGGSDQDSGKIITRKRSGSMHRIRTSSMDEQDDDDDDDDESHWLHQAWIVGIPHPFRGPKELQETLYFWQGVEKLPLFTLPLPHQCGGVQDILPLVSHGGSSISSRNDGMWLRLMVATVHGECMELGPSVQSNFAGNMYNPGYLVLRDNVEYIEDEDELDKVMVEVRDEKYESEEEGTVVASPLGAKVGGDIVDEELQEAIRLSLLESQGKSKSSNGDDDGSSEDEDDNEIVVVRDAFGDDDNDLVIPCEPEPFLRKKLLPDFESDTMMINVPDSPDGDISAKDAEFASEILSILPKSDVAQERWEKQKNVVPPKNPLTKEAPFPEPQAPPTNGATGEASGGGKTLGKGKRTKAGNLEMTLKASVSPALRQYLIDGSQCWADGSGASLQPDAWEHAVSLPAPTAPAKFPVVNQQEGSKEQGLNIATEGTSAKAAEDNNANANIASKAASALTVHIPERSKTDVEKEIAMELLQLSPRPTALAVPPNLNITNGAVVSLPGQPLPPASQGNGSTEVDLGGIQVAIIELKDYSGTDQQYSCTGAVEIPLTLEDCGLMVDEADAPTPSPEKEHAGGAESMEIVGNESTENLPQKSVESKAADASDPGKANTQDAPNDAKREAPEKTKCAACQGRMVIHSCGKRALPIDFEAIARAEKERKERQEEEKRKAKIEKRKQADAKRREAKKLKKEREKRAKLEKEAELRRMRDAKIAEARANMANIGDCLKTPSSPQLNGVAEAAEVIPAQDSVKLPKVPTVASKATGAVEIHFAIADAWKEHAEKFTAKAESATEQPVAVVTENGWANGGPANTSNVAQSNTLDALASMAEAASPQDLSQSQKRTIGAVMNGLMAPAPAPSTLTPTNAPAPLGQQPAQHGFFSSPEASATSAAMIARRNQVLNSYHAMEAGAAGPRVVDLSNQRRIALNAASQETRAHSFQISPMGNSNQPHRAFGQQNLAVFQQRHTVHGVPAAAPSSSQPYFGYTQLSSHFRPRVNLGSYSASAIITANQRHAQAAPQAAPASNQTEVTARVPVVAPNRDSYFPGSQPQPPASVAAPVAHRTMPVPSVAAPSNTGVWMHHAQALGQARAVQGTMLVQPQLHLPAPVAAAVANAQAQLQQHLRGAQPTASNAPGAPLNQHVNSAVYNNTTTTTNP